MVVVAHFGVAATRIGLIIAVFAGLLGDLLGGAVIVALVGELAVRGLLHGGLGLRLHAGQIQWLAHAPLEERAALFAQVTELLQRGQVREVVEPEELEEVSGGAIQQRAPGLFLAAHHLDELTLAQRVERVARVHAADVIHLGTRHGLAIGHDGQRLDLRTRQAHRLGRHQLPHEGGVARSGAELIPTCDEIQADTALFVVVGQLDEQWANLPERSARRGGQLLLGERLLRHENEALEDGLEARGIRRGRQPSALEARTTGVVASRQWEALALFTVSH